MKHVLLTHDDGSKMLINMEQVVSAVRRRGQELTKLKFINGLEGSVSETPERIQEIIEGCTPIR